MPANPWLAIDAATPPRKRARELKRSWERFLGDGRLDAVRMPIADSWRRSHAAGVDPSGDHLAPVLADEEETSARLDVHPLATALPLIEDSLAAIADESAHLIVVSDAQGLLLWIGGNARVRMAGSAESMNFTEGALWSENGAGTNAIGTALAADHAVQVFAAEHFNEVVQSWTCAAAPVADPERRAAAGHRRSHRQDDDGAPARPRPGVDHGAGSRVPVALGFARAGCPAARALSGADRDSSRPARARHVHRTGPGRPSPRVAARTTARTARRRRRTRAGIGDAGLRGAGRARGGVHRARGRHEGRSATSPAAEAEPARA